MRDFHASFWRTKNGSGSNRAAESHQDWIFADPIFADRWSATACARDQVLLHVPLRSTRGVFARMLHSSLLVAAPDTDLLLAVQNILPSVGFSCLIYWASNSRFCRMYKNVGWAYANPVACRCLSSTSPVFVSAVFGKKKRKRKNQDGGDSHD